ncbi:GntR family transcriptional regulator [Lederbergia lenta]|uniref:GntR family transcriptional regulator n=1 Tax=Lederbergia lenta TaxID=1467 RepID=A0A2X4VUS9_LEDLE|nr:GntR family transcriptional regulator [Lederbergia lenta]MCM3112665.1 GntR family transcriptional regulator [Lederbergia lenta]MEC2323703.1 GntR family transcriptional regulator [Lederbergia lenta]SQI51598.1 GntR family transcriptional regulator [Lederbergia lenta]
MELPIRLSKDSREPIYFQVEEQIKALIASGQLNAGTLLPSIRSLSKDLEVSMITTRRAYQNLEQQGFIRTTQGKGTFVSEIEEGLKKDVKIAAVKLAFETAIETALRHDYSLEEAETIFQNIVENYQGKGE